MASENTCPALRLRIDSAIVGFCEVNRVEGGHRTIRFCNGRAAVCRPTPSDALVPPKLLMVHHKLRPLAAFCERRLGAKLSGSRRPFMAGAPQTAAPATI